MAQLSILVLVSGEKKIQARGKNAVKVRDCKVW
jgi:hypothetical protein